MPEDLSGILESDEHTLLATGLGATEGPLWHPEGYLTFVDLRGSNLLRWDADSRVSVVREGTGEGNGCTFDRQGRTITAVTKVAPLMAASVEVHDTHVDKGRQAQE